jgi:hypothetical protein
MLYGVAVLGAATALAHCDGMDGPVVKAAQAALAAGDVNLVLIWVQKKDEAEIRKAFQQTLGVRKLSAEAKQLADTWFFETLVRIHRAGEGAPFTGLKPAGRDLGPAIPAADKAIEIGSVDDVLKLLTDTAQKGVRDRFAELVAKKSFKKDDLDAGREYVEAYVVFVHYVEGLYQAASKSPHGHSPETEEHEGHGGEQAHEHGHDAQAEEGPEK